MFLVMGLYSIFVPWNDMTKMKILSMAAYYKVYEWMCHDLPHFMLSEENCMKMLNQLHH